MAVIKFLTSFLQIYYAFCSEVFFVTFHTNCPFISCISVLVFGKLKISFLTQRVTDIFI